MTPLARWFVAAVAFMPAAGVLAQAQSPAAIEKLLQERVQAFAQAKVKADEKADRAFGVTVGTFKTTPNLKEAARADLVEKAVAAMKRFETARVWPSDPVLGLLDDEFAYNDELARAFAPVNAAYERSMKAYREAKDDDAVTRLLAEKVKLVDANFPGHRRFNGGSTWDGKRVGAKGGAGVQMHMRVGSVKNATFDGVVEQNPQIVGHPIYEVTGTIEGNKLLFVNSKQIQGTPKPVTISGYMSNGRLFLVVGKSSYAVLERTGGPKK